MTHNKRLNIDSADDLARIIRELHTNAIAQGATEAEARTAVHESLVQYAPDLSWEERERRISDVVASDET